VVWKKGAVDDERVQGPALWPSKYKDWIIMENQLVKESQRGRQKKIRGTASPTTSQNEEETERTESP
jgi:hypothetical protein